MIDDLIKMNRSRRRFYGEETVSRETLRKLVDLARLSASAGNLQPLKYILSSEQEKNDAIFSCLAWAAYLKDWPGPAEDERPSAYIVMLGDTTITKNFWCDHGIAAQSILLGATERGLGGCILGSIKKNELRKSLRIPDEYEILLVLAIGKPKEVVVIEDAEDDMKYWKDKSGIHHVPKRSLDDIIIG